MHRGTLQTGFETQRTATGDIVQAGVRRRPGNAHRDVLNTMGWMTRAVILQSYYADQDDRNGWVKNTQRAIVSDVRTYGRYSRTLMKVPHLQNVHGLFDEDFRTPRASSQNIEGGALVTQPSGSQAPTPAENMDGDHVIIGFLDNDPNQPAVLPFMMAHPKAAYTPGSADGRVRRIRHQGTLLEWDQNGNFTIDATTAAKQELAQGQEQSNSGTGGKVTFVTKDGSGNLASIHINENAEIHLASAPGSGNEPVPLGNVIKDIMGQIFQALAQMQVGTAVGPSSPPLNIAAFQLQFNRFASDEHSSDFVFTRKSY